MLAVALPLMLLLVTGSSLAPRSEAPRSRPALERLEREYVAALAAKDPHSRALHAYLLRDAADRYAYRLNLPRLQTKSYTFDYKAFQRGTSARVHEANRYGASIQWCEIDADWIATGNGYATYLSLWPDGPYAEQAWWRGKLAFGCRDGDGSQEETRGLVADYTAFLKRFPHGKHAWEARKLLRQYQWDIDPSMP